MKFRPGGSIGGWSLSRQIGKGGNGVVFEAQKGTQLAALKILYKTRDKRRFSRFADEVKAMERCKDLAGVIPLYESFFPTGADEDPPWFAMAMATRLSEALGPGPGLDNVVIAIEGIASALAAVHDLGLSHRDVKPDNLFLLDETWAVGDLGLADFEDKASLTAPMEKVGPAHYIAPEMLNSASTAEGKPADVYSLAKTLWVLATGQKFPLPGHQTANIQAMTISAYTSHHRARMLDTLLEAATCFDPASRPTMHQFLRELRAWLIPPDAQDNIRRPDLSEYRRLLEGRAAKYHANEQAEADADKLRREQGLRMRERFRPIAVELKESLNELHFISTALSIDNYHYGFEVTGAFPGEIAGEFHRIRITVHTHTIDPLGTQFRISAWYRYSEKVLWEAKREFLSGGQDEELQVAGMINDLRNQLYFAVTEMLAADSNLNSRE